MANARIALYIGDEMYPSAGNDVASTIRTLQSSPLTSPILSLVNASAQNPDQLVYNEAGNPLFDSTGAYLGASTWASDIQSLRAGGSVQEVYLSFSTNGTAYMASLLASNPPAARQILTTLRETLGFDGIDLDDESGDYSPGDPIYVVATAAIQAGLKVTAAPYMDEPDWTSWVQAMQKQGGTIAWLNLQCYAGGKGNNPGTWLDIGVPIVAGSCANCGGPQTTCSPADMQALFTLWTTGKGSVSCDCWDGTPNTSPQAIGGGFIWAYASIAGSSFLAYMNALKNGLGM
jgi:hypothetical protein